MSSARLGPARVTVDAGAARPGPSRRWWRLWRSVMTRLMRVSVRRRLSLKIEPGSSSPRIACSKEDLAGTERSVPHLDSSISSKKGSESVQYQGVLYLELLWRLQVQEPQQSSVYCSEPAQSHGTVVLVPVLVHIRSGFQASAGKGTGSAQVSLHLVFSRCVRGVRGVAEVPAPADLPRCFCRGPHAHPSAVPSQEEPQLGKQVSPSVDLEQLLWFRCSTLGWFLLSPVSQCRFLDWGTRTLVHRISRRSTSTAGPFHL